MKPLADWLGWWIETHCACGHMALVPVRMLVDQLGGHVPLSSVRDWLKCSHCGLRPTSTDMTDDPSGMRGYKGLPQPAQIASTGSLAWFWYFPL
jgi:hypothetical protein